jgi:hypothetical protein
MAAFGPLYRLREQQLLELWSAPHVQPSRGLYNNFAYNNCRNHWGGV